LSPLAEMNIGSILLNAAITGILSGTLLAFLGQLFFKRKTEQIAAEVRRQVEQELLRYRSSMLWKEQSLAELLAPLAMQSQRTERAFKSWKGKNLFLEAKIIGEGNRTIRDLLLSKGHLIPSDLLLDAHQLVEHFDRWLEKFEKVRGTHHPSDEQPFVFVGPDGFPFSTPAAKHFETRFSEQWTELYGASL